MLRAGCVLLSIWAVPNLLLAVGIFGALVLLGHDAPALAISFDEAERAALASASAAAGGAGDVAVRLLATVNALAVLGNAIIAAFCALVVVLVWRDIARRSHRSSSLALVAAATLFVQLAGFASDAKLGHANLVANLVSSAVLVLGLALCAGGLRRASST